MDQLRGLMQTALAQRLAQHFQSEVAPVQNIPNLPGASVQDRLVGGLRLGTLPARALLDTLGLAREGIDYGAKALTGGIAQEVNQIQQIDNPVLRNAATAGSFLLPGGPATAIAGLLAEAGRLGLPSPFGPGDFANAQAAANADQGNLISKARAANEGLASQSPLATGLLNQLVNPLTYVTGGGTEAARAEQQAQRIAGGLGIDLNTVNQILYPEGQALGKVASSLLGPAARGVLDRTGLNEMLRRRYDLPVAPEAADLAKYLEAQGLPVPAKVPTEPSDLAPTQMPDITQMAKDNIAQFQRDMGLVRGNAPGVKGPTLPPLQDVPLPPELGPAFPERGNLPGDQLLPGIGRNGGRGIGPLEPPLQDVPLPPPVQPVSDLLNAAQATARPTALEQLLGAGRAVAGREVQPRQTIAQIEAAVPAVPGATNQAMPEPIVLVRDLLATGDNGKGMVYPPNDPAFWAKRTGLDPAQIPALLDQLKAEGALASDGQGGLINTLITGGPRTATPVSNASDYTPTAEDIANGWGSEISLPFDQQPSRRTPWADLSPAELVTYLKNQLNHHEGVLQYARAKYGKDSTDAAEVAQRVANVKSALREAQQAAKTGATPAVSNVDIPPVAPPADLGAGLELPDMPQYSGQSRADVLGTLTPAEVGTLAQLAYRNPSALKYAMAAHPNPADLAGAALDRITGNRTLIENLSANHPDLAGKLAYLPDSLTPRLAPLGQGAQNAFGWLTRPLTTGLPVTRLGVAGSGGLIGAATGGLAPATDEEQRRVHALQGAAVGAAFGLGTTTRSGQRMLQALPVAREFGGSLLGEANAAQRAAMDRPSQGITKFSTLANAWRVQATSTIRNLIQDELTARLWNSNAGIRQQMMNDNWSSLVQLYNLGQRNGYDALPQQTTSLLDKWGLTGYEPKVGASFNTMNQTMIKDLSAIDLAKAEAIFAGLNPAQGGVPLAGLAFGAIKGYARAWQESLFTTLNEFTRLAARHAAFQDEFAPAMQVAAQHFVNTHGATGILDPAAGFSAQEVGQALGQQAQDEWAAQVQKVVKMSEQRALDIHGDFSHEVAGGGKTAGQHLSGVLNVAVPFSSWALKAYPRTAAMMLDHPGVSLAIMLLTLGQAEKVQREGKSGLVGGIPIDANTPLVGGIAKKMLGNFPGQAYVNLLGSLTPISTSALLSPDQPVNANLYQKASEFLDRAGFSFNPLVQAAAYAANKDYQRPGPLSRTAGLEMAMPGPDAPSFALGPLNAARVAAGGSAQHTTAEDRRLAELFYMATGHQISDPTNVSDPQRSALLASTLDPNSEIRKLAAQSTGQANVARNLVSFISPASVQAAPAVEQQAEAASYAARHAPPARYDPRTINALMNSGNMAQYIEAVMRQRANAGTQGEVSPLLQLTSQSAGQDRAQMYLAALAAQGGPWGSPLIGTPTSLINQILGIAPPSIEIGGPSGGQR